VHSLSALLTQAVHRQATTNSRREWQYHMLHVYSVSFWRWAFKARTCRGTQSFMKK